jgi:hypothetical protein
MKRCLAASVCLMALAVKGSAEDLESFQTRLDHRSIETRTLTIRLAPVDDDVRFSVTLTNKVTGIHRKHEFDAPVPEMPEPFQVEESYYCGTSVVLVTVEYPWRHDWPQVVRTVETFAFRESDFKFIDVAFGPLTDIALADDTAYEPSDLEILPPIRVRCLTGQVEKPFEFFEKETK